MGGELPLMLASTALVEKLSHLLSADNKSNRAPMMYLLGVMGLVDVTSSLIEGHRLSSGFATTELGLLTFGVLAGMLHQPVVDAYSQAVARAKNLLHPHNQAPSSS
ncbi:hypothetical protein KC726_05275 [Candidatus Woesebacteria bacterium]|nr:hypothetical protein [Candidatus Woesebacteria bacterium]